MCGCKLEIVTESGGERTVFRANGVFESRDGEERALYQIDGDEAELIFSETFLENRRRGECGLQARFQEGKESSLRIGNSSLSGEIPVRTALYRLQKTEKDRRIELRYDLLGSENIQTFLLKIQIIFFSEEK